MFAALNGVTILDGDGNPLDFTKAAEFPGNGALAIKGDGLGYRIGNRKGFILPSVSSPVEKSIASSAVAAVGPQTETGGIDLSKIELILKDEKFVSSLNPADLKILRAVRALKQGWNSLAVLYVHEVRLLLKDKIILEKDMTQRAVLQNLLTQLERKDCLDPQAQGFCHILKAQAILAQRKTTSVSV